jgi:lia operon protein LiaG
VAALAIAAAIGIASGAFRSPTIAGAQAVTVDETKVFPSSGLAGVDVNAVSEQVRVTQTSDERITVRFHGSVRGVRPDALPALSAEAAGGVLSIRILHWPRVGLAMLASELIIDLAVPRSYGKDLSVRTVSGEVDMDDHTLSGLSVTTTSGAVHLQVMHAARAAVRTTSGELTAAELSGGKTTLTTVSGEIDVRSLSGDVYARTTSGAVRLRYAAQPGAVEIGSTSGEVTLLLPAEARFTLDARSTSGDIRCDFPLTLSGGKGAHALKGTAGGGATPVRIQTVSGEIAITR